ncbi:MAG TPA: polyphenol oxidase family protein, partial [Acidimicrobiales bacterium]|nr:polyphenol oxidase family protein [Acidimicrobiales bacterium]
GGALAVLTADCAPVALASSEGVIAVAHAGWRGVAAGVIEATVAEMEALGATAIEAAIGPCIHAECYEFGPAELDGVAARLGDDVRSRTSAGRPALDLPAAVRAALRRAGVETVTDVDVCTACSPDHFSWRARQELQRQATVVWR